MPKADLQFVEPFLKQLKQLNNNNQCIYPGCKKKPVNSHIIANSVLKLLVDQDQSEIFTWERSDDDIVINTIHGNEWDNIYKQPKKVSIKKGVTYPIFCCEHDNDVFEALEKLGLTTYEPHQVALLAYRALCYKTWNPNLEKKLELLLSNKDDKIVQQYFRLFSLKTLLKARQKFEDMLAIHDYRQMRWIKKVLHIDPCFACTDAFIPFHGDEDIRNIANGNTITTPEDLISFTLFPEKNLNATICVITWFRDSVRGERFRESLELDNPSDDEVRNNIINNALRMSLLYISQAWWNMLTPEEQDTILELQLSDAKFLQDL